MVTMAQVNNSHPSFLIQMPQMTPFTLTLVDWGQAASINIFDALGQNVYSGQSNNVQKTINTLSIDGGTYFLHVSDGEQLWQFQLIIDHQ